MGIKLISKSETEIKFSDMYALEFINWGLIHESVLSNPGGCLMRHETEVIVFLVDYKSAYKCILRNLLIISFEQVVFCKQKG